VRRAGETSPRSLVQGRLSPPMPPPHRTVPETGCNSDCCCSCLPAGWTLVFGIMDLVNPGRTARSTCWAPTSPRPSPALTGSFVLGAALASSRGPSRFGTAVPSWSRCASSTGPRSFSIMCSATFGLILFFTTSWCGFVWGPGRDETCRCRRISAGRSKILPERVLTPVYRIAINPGWRSWSHCCSTLW